MPHKEKLKVQKKINLIRWCQAGKTEASRIAGLEDRRGQRKKDQTLRTEPEEAQIEIERLGEFSKSLFNISTCMDWRVDFLPCKAKIRRHPDGWQGFLTQSGRKIRRQDMCGGDFKQALTDACLRLGVTRIL